MTTDYLATWLACEDHDEPGHCTDECLRLAQEMSGGGGDYGMIYSDYLGGVSSIDVSGCHRPEPMPEVVLALVDGTVTASYEHPEECQCDADNCPAYLSDNR